MWSSQVVWHREQKYEVVKMFMFGICKLFKYVVTMWIIVVSPPNMIHCISRVTLFDGVIKKDFMYFNCIFYEIVVVIAVVCQRQTGKSFHHAIYEKRCNISLHSPKNCSPKLNFVYNELFWFHIWTISLLHFISISFCSLRNIVSLRRDNHP